jgi:hypothetical protein
MVCTYANVSSGAVLSLTNSIVKAFTRKCWYVPSCKYAHSFLIPLTGIRKTRHELGHTRTQSSKTSISSKIRLFWMLAAGRVSSPCTNRSIQHNIYNVIILHRFAVQAGAKHVVGVDMSTIIDSAKEIVKLNGMSDKITLIRGKMEEVDIGFPKVDIIISEWMGYFLLYESMLDTVLYARDRYLAPNGLIFPDKATMFMAAIEDAEYRAEKIECKLLSIVLLSAKC